MYLKEIINLVNNTFRKNLYDTKEYLKNKYKWNNHDTRIAVFSKCMNATDITFLLLTFQKQHLTSYTWWRSNTLFSKDGIDNMIFEYKKFIRSSFLNSNFICIESSLRTILREIDPEACNKGTSEFEGVYKNLLARSNLQKYDNIFKLMRLLRNTFHNNTFYFHKSKSSDSVIFKGKKYIFETGKPIDFMSWEFLIDAYMEYIMAIKDIIETEEISKVKEIIDPSILTQNVIN
jgi:hypothetical protein